MWGQGGPDNHKELSSGHISCCSTPQVKQIILNFLYYPFFVSIKDPVNIEPEDSVNILYILAGCQKELKQNL